VTCHTVVYYSSSVGTSDSELRAVKDDVLTRTTENRYLVPSDRNRIDWAFAYSQTLKSVMLVSPSLEVRRTRQYLKYAFSGTLGTGFRNYVEKFIRPITLVPSEELSVFARTGTSAGEPVYVVVNLAPETLPEAPAGDVIRIVGRGSTTLTPNEWTSVKLTLDYALEAGTYALINFVPISATCIVARALIPGQAYRPGRLGIAGSALTETYTVHSLHDILLGHYNMGLFTHITVPEFQFFSTGADTSQLVIMDVVKVG